MKNAVFFNSGASDWKVSEQEVNIGVFWLPCALLCTFHKKQRKEADVYFLPDINLRFVHFLFPSCFPAFQGMSVSLWFNEKEKKL